MTDRLDEIKARLGAATPSPWKADTIENVGNNWLIGTVLNAGSDQEGAQWIVTTDGLHASECTSGGAEEDTQFIAHSPDDIKWLIAEVERLEEQLAGYLYNDFHDSMEN